MTFRLVRSTALPLGCALMAGVASVAASECTDAPAACFRASHTLASSYELSGLPSALQPKHALTPVMLTSAFLGTNFSLAVDIIIVVAAVLVLTLVCWAAYACAHREKPPASSLATLGQVHGPAQAKQQQYVPQPYAPQQHQYAPPPLMLQQPQRMQPPPQPRMQVPPPLPPQQHVAPLPTIARGYHPTPLPSHTMAPHPLQPSPVDMHISPGLHPKAQVVYAQPGPGEEKQPHAESVYPMAPPQAHNPYAPPQPPAAYPAPRVPPSVHHTAFRPRKAPPVNRPTYEHKSEHLSVPTASGRDTHFPLEEPIPIVSEFGVIAPGQRNQHGLTQERTLGNWTRDSN